MSINTIYLSEDNAGGLLVGNAERGWYDATFLTHEVTFEEMAQALLDGETDSWTVERFDHDDLFENDIVAEYTDGKVHDIVNPGVAASAWLGIDRA